MVSHILGFYLPTKTVNPIRNETKTEYTHYYSKYYVFTHVDHISLKLSHTTKYTSN